MEECVKVVRWCVCLDGQMDVCMNSNSVELLFENMRGDGRI